MYWSSVRLKDKTANCQQNVMIVVMMMVVVIVVMMMVVVVVAMMMMMMMKMLSNGSNITTRITKRDKITITFSFHFERQAMKNWELLLKMKSDPSLETTEGESRVV